MNRLTGVGYEGEQAADTQAGIMLLY